ncbi:MAG: hypothetical protein LAT84_12075, partial [Balneolia bacterium]|nr:hypothetical protein [Balneolia bacterium]
MHRLKIPFKTRIFYLFLCTFFLTFSYSYSQSTEGDRSADLRSSHPVQLFSDEAQISISPEEL